MPARNITNRYVYSSGRVATTKGMHSQGFESLLEQDFLLMLEFDRSVQRFASQPITIRWSEENRRYRYTPDVLVEYDEIVQNRFPYLKNTLFEIKPEAVLKKNWSKLKPKFKAATRWCKEYDCRFRIITEKYIQTPYLKNIKFLLQYRSERFKYVTNDIRSNRQQIIRITLFELARATPKQLLNAIPKNGIEPTEYIPYIWHLINCNLIGVDLTLPLTMDTPIWSLEYGSNLSKLKRLKPNSDIWDLIDQKKSLD